MPVSLKVFDASPIQSTLKTLVAQLSKSKVVTIDEAWLKANAPEWSSYAEFKTQFISILKTVMRSRFITEGKSEEFAISFDEQHLTYVFISLKGLDASVEFKIN